MKQITEVGIYHRAPLAHLDPMRHQNDVDTGGIDQPAISVPDALTVTPFVKAAPGLCKNEAGNTGWRSPLPFDGGRSPDLMPKGPSRPIDRRCWRTPQMSRFSSYQVPAQSVDQSGSVSIRPSVPFAW